jgi:hypothetical protein
VFFNEPQQVGSQELDLPNGSIRTTLPNENDAPMMMSTPPRMVIQQSLARISSLYHASATTPSQFPIERFRFFPVLTIPTDKAS